LVEDHEQIRRGTPGSLPPPPAIGLYGREHERADLQELLSADHVPPIWITGYDGIGKTSLAGEVARDLLQSGRFDRVVYTSLGRHGIPEVAYYDLGQALFGPEFKLSADALAQIEEALRATPTLVIWDDVNAILYGGALALDQHDLVAWYQAAAQLASQGKSALCLISDGPDLPPSARRLAGVTEFRVGAMMDADAFAMAEALGRLAEIPFDPQGLSQLVEWFGGHPLALRCLAAAQPGSWQQAVAMLSAQVPGLSAGEGRFRNRAADLALDCLARAVPTPLADHLADLGVFVSGFIQNLGPEIMGLTRETWVEQSTPLAAAGLVWDEPLPILTIPMVRLHPTLSRWATQRLSATRRAELLPAHAGHYLGFATWIFKSASRLREDGPRLFVHDIGNVRQGLASMLADGDVAAAISVVQIYNALLKELGLEQESNRASESVAQATRALLPDEGPWTREGVELALRQAEALLSAGNVQNAGTLLSQLATRFEKQGGVDYQGQAATLDRVRTLVDLARALQVSQQNQVAIRALSEAADLLDPFAADPELRTRRAEIYSDLLQVHLQLNQLEQAEQACQRAMSALGDMENPHLRGTLHSRAALVALRRGDLQRAREELGRASEIMTDVGDLPGLATIEGQFATVALRPPANVPEAIEHLEKAIGYAHQAGEWLVEAQLHSQVAQLAMQAQSPGRCEQHLLEAADLYEENGATGLLAVARGALAEFYLQQSQLDDALAEADRALAAAEASGQPVPWEIYFVRQRIAEARGDECSTWRALTNEAYAHSPAAAAMVARWTPLIDALVKASHGEALGMEAAGALESMEKTPQWQKLARTMWHVVSGERGEALHADLDHVDTMVIRTLLDRIAHASAPDGEESRG